MYFSYVVNTEDDQSEIKVRKSYLCSSSSPMQLYSSKSLKRLLAGFFDSYAVDTVHVRSLKYCNISKLVEEIF